MGKGQGGVREGTPYPVSALLFGEEIAPGADWELKDPEAPRHQPTVKGAYF